MLEQNPRASWKDLLGAIEMSGDGNPDLAQVAGTEHNGESDDDELASFKL